MADNEELANIISSLMSGKEDDSASAVGVGQDIAVSISESLGKFFNRMRGPEQMTPVSPLNPETVTGDVPDSPVISYLNTAFLPVLKSINDAVQPPTKEEKEETRRNLADSLTDAFRNVLFGRGGTEDEDGEKPKKSEGFISKILSSLGSLGDIGGNFIKGVIGLSALAIGLVGFAFGLKKLMEVVGVDFSTLIIATATITGFFLLIRQIGKDFSQIAKGVLAFGLAVGALFGFAASLKIFTDVDFVKVTLGGAAVFGFFKVIAAIGAMFAQVARGALALGLIGGTLFLFSKALETFSKVDFKAVIFGGIALAGFAVAAGIMGTFAVPIALGAAAIAALGVALIPFAYALKVFGAAAQKFIPVLETFGKVAGGFVEVVGGVYLSIIEGITAAYGKLAETLGSVVEKLGDTAKKVLDTISDFSNNVSPANILAASAAIGTLAASLAAFAAADFGSALLAAGSGILDFFTGRIGNIELIGILASMSEQTGGLDALADSVSNLSREMAKFSTITYDNSFVDYLDDLRKALNGEINLSAGLFEKGLAFFGGTEISMFSGLMKLAESAEPMKMFAEATDLAADAITRLASALVAFDADTFDKFISATASKDFTQLQENINNSGMVASAVFATQLEEAVSAEVSRQIAADVGAADVGGPVVIQNSAAPTVNTFTMNSSLQPNSTDVEILNIIGHGDFLR
jgi:hypothetical protein